MQRAPLKLAVFSAAGFEAEPLLSVLAENQLDFVAHTFGVGALKAARSIVNLSQAARDRHAIFIGTCGTFGNFDGPSLISANEVHWLPTCERAGLSYAIPDSAPPVKINRPLPWTSSLRVATVICAPNISLTNSLPPSLNPSNCVENIELYSCAEALQDSALSLSAILCTTNAVGPGAHEQWVRNFKNAARLTADFVRENL